MTPDELKDLEQRAVAQPALYVRSLCREVRRLTAELAAAQADTARLREFAAYIIRDECWGAGNRDGGTVQNEAARLGILRRVEMPTPCGEGCGCLENGCDFPAWCYRFTWTLDAARPAGEREG